MPGKRGSATKGAASRGRKPARTTRRTVDELLATLDIPKEAVKVTFKPLAAGTPRADTKGKDKATKPAAPLPGVVDLEDSVTLHPETDEEAALEAEAEELQRIADLETKAEQERQEKRRKIEEARTASSARCAALRSKIQGLQHRILDIHTRRETEAPVEEGYPPPSRHRTGGS